MAKPLDRKGKRLNIGTKNTAVKERIVEQDINFAVKEAVLYTLVSKPVEERLDYLQTLPSHLSSLIANYIPKQKDTDQDLVASHISLMKSYEHLPGVNDLAGKCHILSTELEKAQRRIRELEFFQKHIIESPPPSAERKSLSPRTRAYNKQRKMYTLLKKVQKNADEYVERKDEIPFSHTQWIDRLIEIYGDDYYRKRIAPTPVEEFPEPESPQTSSIPSPAIPVPTPSPMEKEWI